MPALLGGLMVTFTLVTFTLVSMATAAMFPYDEGAGYTVQEDIPFELPLSTPFIFAEQEYASVFISENGVISFGGAFVGSPAAQYEADSILWVAPYGMDIGGSETYGRINVTEYGVSDVTVLEKAAADVQEQNPGLTFSPVFVFVITWVRVKPFPAVAATLEENTFQVAITTDGVAASFAIFLYDTLESGPAVVGVSGGDPTKGYRICGSGTESVKTLPTTAQLACGTAGTYVFRVDTLPNSRASCTPTYAPDACTTTQEPTQATTATTARAKRCRKR